MNCDEANHHLLDYLDKTLDTSTMTRVATHLISCARCGAEADELTDCVEQVAALPMVDPPIGFAQRVMAHVRELEEKPTIWQRLFLPWGKIPLSATALVMVGVIGIFLYQKDDRLKQAEPNNVTLSAVAEPSKSESEAKQAVVSQSDNKDNFAAGAPVAQAKRMEAAAARAALPASNRIAAANSAVEARLEEFKGAKRPPIQAREVSNSIEPGRFSSDVFGFGGNFAPAGLRPAAPQTAPVPAEKAAVPLFERNADIEFIVRRHPTQRRDQLSAGNLDTLRKAAEADTSLPSTPASRAASDASVSAVPSSAPIAEIRFYNVAPEHYEYFKIELANESIIESESRPAAKEKENALADRPLLIKVTILPPAIAEPSTPSR